VFKILSAVFFFSLLFFSIFFLQQVSWTSIETFLQAVPLQCPLKKFTGLSCAFCGMTHAWIAVFRGEFRKSIEFNALAMPLMAFLAFTFGAIFGFKMKASRILSPAVIWACVTIAMVYAIARNLK
jgi:hypothetical protein